jgi:hypothetical protein
MRVLHTLEMLLRIIHLFVTHFADVSTYIKWNTGKYIIRKQ